MKDYVCSRSFEKVEVQPGGDVYFCCPDWLPRPIGNLTKQSLKEIWNAEFAQEVRRSMFDGSFKYCNHKVCPFIVSKSKLVKRRDELAGELAEIVRTEQAILPAGPKIVKCSHDRSCNLACPTCRNDFVSYNHNSQEGRTINLIQDRLIEALDDLEFLEISGAGDPFASEPSLRLLKAIHPVKHKNLKLGLFTNGLLWTRRRWDELSNLHGLHIEVNVSIDAATAETYALNRRGGKFNILRENLAFFRELKERGHIRLLQMNMVVQENNFREMKDFIQLGREYGADDILFSQLVNWGTFSDEAFQARAVHLPSHPLYKEFTVFVADTMFRSPDVFMGNLASLER